MTPQAPAAASPAAAGTDTGSGATAAAASEAALALHTRVTGLAGRAEQRPDEPALVIGHRDGSSRAVTAAQLVEGVRRTAEALREAGVRGGEKAVVTSRDPYARVAAVHSLLLLGAVPVLTGPRSQVGRSVRKLAPEVVVADTGGHVARKLLGQGGAAVRVALVTGRATPLRPLLGRRLALQAPDDGPLARAPEIPPYKGPGAGHRQGPAALVFTSGTAGVPKAAEYPCATLLAQLDALQDLLAPRPDTALLSCLPLTSLLGPLLGVRTVVPAVRHRAPARTRAKRLVGPLLDHRANVVAGSPAVLRVIAEHCRNHGRTLDSVERVVSFGAPLRRNLTDLLHAVLPRDAEILSAYGTAECLPASTITASELHALRAESASEGQPPGTCLGVPVPGAAVRLLNPDDTGLGEIALAGPNVSPAYHAAPEATAAATLRHDGALLHRTGDLGRFDDEGRLWFHGRLAERVTGADATLPTESAEAATETVPGVRRTALVGVGPAGAQQPVLVAELEPFARKHRGTASAAHRALYEALAEHPHGRHISPVLLHPGFPTDPGLNSRIDRARLAVWAAKRLGRKAR